MGESGDSVKKLAIAGLVVSSAALFWAIFTDCGGSGSDDPGEAPFWWLGTYMFFMFYGREIIGVFSKFADALKEKWSQTPPPPRDSGNGDHSRLKDRSAD